MAFVAGLKMVANAWMRTGDSAASTDFEEFFDELLTIIPKIVLDWFVLTAGSMAMKC